MKNHEIKNHKTNIITDYDIKMFKIFHEIKIKGMKR